MEATIFSSNFHARALVKISMFQAQDLQYDFSTQYRSWARSHCGHHYDCVLYLHVSDVHQHSFNRSL